MLASARKVLAWHAPLACFAALMVVLAAVSAVGYVADARILVGVPIWAKPLKFSLSFILYAATLGWMLSQVRRPRVRRTGWWAGTVLAVASALEMSAIVLQVVRGRQSHFDVATPFDSAVFSVMGLLVAVIFLATLVIAVALVLSPMADRAVAWAVRLGITISVAGLSVGFLMLLPTAAQSAQTHPALRGAHSVGVADGGPAVPLLGWSATGGDLRVPHFIGIHGLQVLPLLALGLGLARTRLPERTRVQLVVLAAAAYAGLVALALWQALRGQPLFSPDAVTWGALAVLLALAGAGAAAVGRTARRRPLPAG